MTRIGIATLFLCWYGFVGYAVSQYEEAVIKRICPENISAADKWPMIVNTLRVITWPIGAVIAAIPYRTCDRFD